MSVKRNQAQRKAASHQLMKLHEVPNGARCKHTGKRLITTRHYRIVNGRKKFLQKEVETFPQDKGMYFMKACDAFQIETSTRKQIILGGNDLVICYE